MRKRFSCISTVRKIQPYLLQVVLPILVGSSIYICFRATSLRMFDWYRFIGADNAAMSARDAVAPLKPFLPDWAIYSLPNGLWVYSLTAFMLLVWPNGSASKSNSVWPHLGILIGLGSEALQLTGALPGTFDLVDAGFCMVFYFLALILVRRLNINLLINQNDMETAK